jgi:hypothetical protein
MTMARGRELPEIDRLIEEGLSEYGQGNLDSALDLWEQALEIDPGNDQATSYVEYVRQNYELLVGEVSGHQESPAFAISDDEEEYQIEILPGELEAMTAIPSPVDPADDGWNVEEERRRNGRESEELELFADEPSANELPPDLNFSDGDDIHEHTTGREHTVRELGSGINFDMPTREYPSGRASPPTELIGASSGGGSGAHEFQIEIPTPTPGFEAEAAEITPGFGTPGDTKTPPGFSTQLTDIRKRELGFVTPTPVPPPPAEDRHRRASSNVPELKMTLRTPTASQPIATSLLELQYDEPEPPTGERPPIAREDADLIASLPTPRPATGVENGPSVPRSPTASTREMPAATRRPAGLSSELPVVPAIGTPTLDFEAPTQEKPGLKLPLEPPPAVGEATRDLMMEANTIRLPASSPQVPAPPVIPDARDLPLKPPKPDPMISAPTRDLGIRQPRTKTDDEPTGRSQIKDLQRPPPDARTMTATKADIVLPFDPIDARSVQILDEVDDDAPDNEAREDRTRRRITTLFERAGEWGRSGELDRAVAAIDLALAEDPNSALAQKLIHRNRETMMAVFQAFLGDLQRTPTLARPLHELATAPISPRAAFLLSRVDGTLSLDEILDVSGMPRLEAYRYLCQLYLRGILR